MLFRRDVNQLQVQITLAPVAFLYIACTFHILKVLSIFMLLWLCAILLCCHGYASLICFQCTRHISTHSISACHVWTIHSIPLDSFSLASLRLLSIFKTLSTFINCWFSMLINWSAHMHSDGTTCGQDELLTSVRIVSE